jgi:hypothetical protein
MNWSAIFIWKGHHRGQSASLAPPDWHDHPRDALCRGLPCRRPSPAVPIASDKGPCSSGTGSSPSDGYVMVCRRRIAPHLSSPPSDTETKCQHRHRRVVGMQHGARQDMAGQRIDHRPQQYRRLADPVGQHRAAAGRSLPGRRSRPGGTAAGGLRIWPPARGRVGPRWRDRGGSTCLAPGPGFCSRQRLEPQPRQENLGQQRLCDASI